MLHINSSDENTQFKYTNIHSILRETQWFTYLLCERLTKICNLILLERNYFFMIIFINRYVKFIYKIKYTKKVKGLEAICP